MISSDGASNDQSRRLSKDHSNDSPSKHHSQSPDDRSKLEDTPPGTPPPPYLSQSMINTSGCGGGGGQHSTIDLLSPPRSHPSSPTFMVATNDGGGGGGGGVQKHIISMEDDEASDPESKVDEDGPFKALKQLLDQENLVYLAVFLNFVLSNSDPSALLFFLITGLYKEGNVKDMRKWAYEIHSTFLVPRAVSIPSSHTKDFI